MLTSLLFMIAIFIFILCIPILIAIIAIFKAIGKSGKSVEEMNNKLMFSSKKEDWETPHDFYERLNDEFNFTLDPCANEHKHKCSKYYTVAENGLLQDWGGETVFCNPPYGSELPKWVKKCFEESQKPSTTVVMLIPARTDTQYFHEYIYHKAEIRFLKGRLKFVGAKNSAPFPSMIVVFKG